MSTTTLLLVIGGAVCVKTFAFVAFLVHRSRQHRAALDAVGVALATAEGVAPPSDDPSGWRLQWAEPGVMLVENTGDADAAATSSCRRP